VVALLLFSMGGLFSIYEGWHKLSAHEPLNKAWVALVVLGLVGWRSSFGSLMGCLPRDPKAAQGRRRSGYWLQNTRNAELVVVLGEDVAALVGLVHRVRVRGAAAATGNAVFDAIGPSPSAWCWCAYPSSSRCASRADRRPLGRRGSAGGAARGSRSRPDIDELLNAITMQMGPT
jgi:hypothetical protein